MAHQLHLYQVQDTYYFRCRIPIDLKCWFAGRDDIKRTLKTKSLTQARRKLAMWSYKTEQVFTAIRSGVLAPSQAQKVVDEYKRNDLKLRTGMAATEAEGAAVSYEGKGSDTRVGTLAKVDMLSVVVEKYIAEYKTTDKAGGPTIYELETKCRQFARLVGDMDIKNVTRDTVLDYLQVFK